MTFMEKVDPRAKLAWCLALILTALLAQKIFQAAVIISLVIVLDCVFLNNLRKYKILLSAMLLVAAQILSLQLLFGREGELLWQWGILALYSGSIPTALLGIARTAAVTLAAVQFVSWTTATDAAMMLISWGVSYRYAMLIVVAKRFLPLMQKEFLAISDSQSVRGYPAETIRAKIRNLPLTFMPMLYRAVRHSADIALAMELKGFGRSRQRTFSRQLHLKPWEKMMIVLLALIFISVNFVLT